MDNLTSASINDSDSNLNEFSKTPISRQFQFRFAFAKHSIRGGLSNHTQKEIPVSESLLVTRSCQMAKAAIAQPSPSPSPSKLIEAKLLVAQVEQKAKGKKKAPIKATKAAVKSTKATRAAHVANEEGSDVEIVEDGTTIKCVSYIPATSISLMLS